MSLEMHQAGVIARDEIRTIIDRPFHLTGSVESRVNPGAIDDDPLSLVGEDRRVSRHRLNDLSSDGECAVLSLESQH